ncbi:MAG TPA: DUF4249 domain-containing protein [Pedobacter sp.]|uniref:DUF4249 domain-containing protein n=1 Tax=Pedobacter sp. TaxID=1411316 RepID=UPI002CA21876|nr:DUF4249 domain-containing protein [Pedobacter sp.]HMI03220.1 DUF4249 domain-containing protein [Pedobacter sp.]
MKKRTYLIGAILCVLAIAGCEKVITLDLDNADPRIVIDANVNDQFENQIVRVSKTYSFSESNKFNGISGAKVVLTTMDGDVINYSETASKGIYRSPRMRGKPGVEYTMTVTVEGKTYVSVSAMPFKVSLDSLTFKQFDFFGSINTYIAANFEDPGYTADQYRYILKVKDKVEEDAVSDDRFNNGNHAANVLYYELDDLANGDTLEVELQCIDRPVYKYFFTLEQISGDGGPPVSPENPPSNFSNGALGVFNAYTSSKRTALIKKP